jgi:serpin B
LAAFEKALTVENVAQWLTKLCLRSVRVAFPKFKVAAEFVLNDVLSEMGMPLAFDSHQADFSGMDGGREPRIYLAAAIHKAFVDVNEEGTEAAAATAISGAVRSAPPEFHADHPFAFLIRDIRSESILFMGRLTNPQQ